MVLVWYRTYHGRPAATAGAAALLKTAVLPLGSTRGAATPCGTVAARSTPSMFSLTCGSVVRLLSYPLTAVLAPQSAQAPPELPAAQNRSATAPAATHPLWVQGPGHVAAGTGAADPCAAAAGMVTSAAAAAMDTTATVAAEAAASASSSAAAAVPCFINGLSAHSALHAVPAGFGQQAQLPQPQRYNDVTVTAYGGGGQQSAAMQVAALHGLAASSLGVGGLTLDRCIGGWSGSNTHDAYPWGQQQGQMQAPGQEHGQQAWMQVQQQQQEQQWQQRQPAPLLLLQQQQPLPPPLHQQLPGGPIASWSVAQPQARAPAHMHGSGAASSLAGSARAVGQFPRHLLPQIPAGLCVPPMVPVPMLMEPLPIEPRWSQASSMGTLDRQSCSSYPSFNTNTSELMRLSNGSLRLSTSGGNSSSSSSALLTMAPHAPPGASGWAAAAAVAQQESPAHVLPSLLQHQQQQTWRHTSQQQQQQLLQSHKQAQEQQLGKLKRSWSDAAEALGPCAHAPPQARPHHPPGHSGCGTFSSLELSRTASLPVGFPGCLFPGTVPRVGVPLGHLCAPQVGGSLTTHGSAIGPNAVAPNTAPILGAPCAHAASEAAPTTHGSFGVPTGVNCARVPYTPAATAQSVSQPLALSSRPLSGPAAGSVTPLLPAWLWHNGLNITLNATVPNHPGGIAWAFRASAPEAVVSPLDQLSAIQPRGSATMTTFLAAAAAPVQCPEAPPSPLKAAPLETAPHAPSSAPALQPALSPLPPIPPTHSIIEQTLAAPTRAVTRAAAAAAAAAPPAAAVTTDSPPASAAFKHLQALFDVPARQAARSLGICVSEFKKRCRRAGIARWPQRRLHCLVRMAELVKAEQGMASDHKQVGGQRRASPVRYGHAVPWVSCNGFVFRTLGLHVGTSGSFLVRCQGVCVAQFRAADDVACCTLPRTARYRRGDVAQPPPVPQFITFSAAQTATSSC